MGDLGRENGLLILRHIDYNRGIIKFWNIKYRSRIFRISNDEYGMSYSWLFCNYQFRNFRLTILY